MSILSKLIKAITHPAMIPAYCKDKSINYRIKLHNAFIRANERPPATSTGLAELDEILTRARIPTDVNDHLVTLFTESMSVAPRLIVELGVRGGETAFVLEQIAGLFGSQVVLVDIEDCSSVPASPQVTFVKSDDVAFAGRFREWCAERRIDPSIDILHIDTSHLYDHTVNEIAAWFPHLSERAKVFFHDTHLEEIFRRRDGSMARAWDNDRGVIRAIEDYFNTPLDETVDFVDYAGGWLIKHSPLCNGFTVLERTPRFNR
jgi:cephalosporin hydroxylase